MSKDSFVGDPTMQSPTKGDLEMGIRETRSNSDLGLESFYEQVKSIELHLDRIFDYFNVLMLDA